MTVDQHARRGRPPVSEEGRRAQRTAISREAVRLFRAHGVSATSGSAISAAAGVSERTLWRLFRSKESCVEPVLSTTIERFRLALRSWPSDLDLGEHLRVTSASAPDDVRADLEAALAVVRLSRDEPGLRAVWLVLQERAEPTFADVIGPRMGLPPDAPEVRVRAAMMNAALRVAADAAADDGGDTDLVADDHRPRLAAALRAVTTFSDPPR
ncbi:TetR/AcrR family transcriptional regulator [Pseudonocardia endophytica]|uniref:TetR family transcriptional regulator n=1 Tax=Pseudonocardia endophytica TaxID=401976 RepID=A0A4R1HTJ3_PSEEN|nr:TetR/AcrR family transcriptional regulator [Pseudonocardia endophytica]TCK26004.1 TetR family transcriptional regulator [Pseudonocardia endophytica]